MGRESRLLRFLTRVTEVPLLQEIRLVWNWDFPDLQLVRTGAGTLEDLLAVLSRPESWGTTEEVAPGRFVISHDGAWVFSLKG